MSWGHGEGHVNPYTYEELDELMGDKDRLCLKRSRAQVWAERDGDLVKILLHETHIVIYYPDDVIELNSGGWRTMLTKNRMNDLLPHPWRVVSDKGVWYVSRNGWETKDAAVFADGCLLYPDGSVGNVGDRDAIVSMRKQIAKYAKDFAQAFMDGEIPAPSGGDCWMCCGVFPNDTDHLISHMEEDYFVPRLLYNAFEERGVPPIVEGMVGNVWRDGESGLTSYDDFMKEWIEKAVRKYMQSRLGQWVK